MLCKFDVLLPQRWILADIPELLLWILFLCISLAMRLWDYCSEKLALFSITQRVHTIDIDDGWGGTNFMNDGRVQRARAYARPSSSPLLPPVPESSPMGSSKSYGQDCNMAVLTALSWDRNSVIKSWVGLWSIPSMTSLNPTGSRAGLGKWNLVMYRHSSWEKKLRVYPKFGF